MGYNQSYCLVIFLNCLLFSSIVPIIPMFAALYFYIKYITDKYNLVFVYYKKYDSGGKIREGVRNYIVFNLFFYILVMESFFALKFSVTKDKDGKEDPDCSKAPKPSHCAPYYPFSYIGIGILIFWIVAYRYIAKKYLSDSWRTEAQLRQSQMLIDQESEMGELLK